MAMNKFRKRLIDVKEGAFAEDGTGKVTTPRGVRHTTFRITRAFPNGADYDKAGKAYRRPLPKTRAEKEGRVPDDLLAAEGAAL